MRARLSWAGLVVILALAAPAQGEAVQNDQAWQAVDQLTRDQKFAEAARKVDGLLAEAKANQDDEAWAKALIRTVQLRMGLHGYETAVRDLKDQPWPKAPLARVAVELFYAHALVGYLDAYSWEIRQRERVAAQGPKDLPDLPDLKSWTAEQIYDEALKAYDRVFAVRETLGKEPVTRLAAYLEPNTYPAGIRGTLRDAVSYLAVQLLANAAYWRPEAANELYRLNFAALLEGGHEDGGPLSLANPAVHPLTRALQVLGDLEAWHAGADQTEAALEARLERLRRLHAAFPDREKRRHLIRHLQDLLPDFRRQPWWAMGMATLAEFQRGSDRLASAHEAAKAGQAAFPGTPGSQACQAIATSLELPEYRVTSMATDRAGQRSLEVVHRNLPKLWLRAYAFDLVQQVEHSRDYNLLPGYEEYQKLGSRPPVAEWTVDLPVTADLRQHRTFVTPPLKGSGLYVIVASARADFKEDTNRLTAVNFVVSDLVLLSRMDGDGSLDVTVVAGTGGRPTPGAKVFLYRFDYGKGHRIQDTQETDATGHVHFAVKSSDVASYFLMAKKADQVAIDPQYQYVGRELSETQSQGAFVYTDRAIYRPGQPLHFKVVAYRGSAATGDFKVAADQSVAVSLVDANGEVVEVKTLKTNAYGSVAGDFAVPTGKLLGQWQVRTNVGNGAASVRVEEYKRPTFTVALKDPEAPLRLNRQAVLKGEANYYFGLPVTNGTVRWRVTRESLYPTWWGYVHGGWSDDGPVSASAQTVATGSSKLDDKGGFSLEFLPRVEEAAKATSAVTYRYTVQADLTDEGGETRSAQRGFRLGFVAVEASLDLGAGFLRSGQAAHVAVKRTSLDGAPRAGEGRFRLVALKQPAAAVPPADLPLASPVPEGDDGAEPRLQTPGDQRRSRVSPSYTPEAELARWADGDEQSQGELTHDDQGLATAPLPALAPGPYRLRYETTDDFGAKFETFKDIVVADSGAVLPLALPAVLLVEKDTVRVGGTARFVVQSGLPDQALFFDRYQAGKLKEHRLLKAGGPALIELPVTAADRGGFGVTLTLVADHQFLRFQQTVFVPWDDKELAIDFTTFRDQLTPGAQETWKLHVHGPGAAAAAAEVLAAMYDKSLEAFAVHAVPSPLTLYPDRSETGWLRPNLGPSHGQVMAGRGFDRGVGGPTLLPDRLKFPGGRGLGGVGRSYHVADGGTAMVMEAAPMVLGAGKGARAKASPTAGSADATKRVGASAPKAAAVAAAVPGLEPPSGSPSGSPAGPSGASAATAPRANFAETAFFLPQLLTDANGDVSLEFKVPDSVTAWNVWVVAFTKDLQAGVASREVRSVKDLMVRPYTPRFLREGDLADLKVVVNNAGTADLTGDLTVDVVDPATGVSKLAAFGVTDASQPFHVAAGGSVNVSFALQVPRDVGVVGFKVVAKAGGLSDGELRPLPILPSRLHLLQTRFVTLRGKDERTMTFPDMAPGSDPTMVSDRLVVGVDGQLFYGVLKALPYLVQYPYECTEQTLNRFVSTGIVSSVFKHYPAVANLALAMSKRPTRLEAFDQNTAAEQSRRLALEESPWLTAAAGGDPAVGPLLDILDARVARAERDDALARLRQAQTASGGFPWFPGGPPSPFMTLYLMHGFAKAAEFGVDVPKDLVVKGWGYLAQHYRETYAAKVLKEDCCGEFLTFLNYVASAYPDPSWTAGALTAVERQRLLAHSFKHWREYTPLLKAYLALTLKRANRPADARLVWDSIMDAAKTDRDLGTFWAEEDRSWLWYRDTTETQAFALRAMMELDPTNPKKDGLVQWLFLDKKLNHWKSTRATAEAIYALVHYLEKSQALGVKEAATVTVGGVAHEWTFDPSVYTGTADLVLAGDRVDPRTMATIKVAKTTKGMLFASAAWSFATDKLPATARGDFFHVTRRFFRRSTSGAEATLEPLAAGAAVAPGDEVEVQLALTTKHEAEYVHLRDPRGAGFEPMATASRWQRHLGIGWYEEVRDSGADFFFEHLPVGEYTFKYRLRAATAGTFRVGPATVQSMYAPEFAAYSAGDLLKVK